MAIKPFHFRLKKVSGHQERLLSAIYSYLPAGGLEDMLIEGVRGAVASHVGEDISLRLEALHQETYSAFISCLPPHAPIAVIGMAPLAHKALLEIDAPLAALAIERMLGGEAASAPQACELTDTEQGVLQYLLLQVLACIHRTCGHDERVHFRLDRLASAEHDLGSISDAGDGVAVLIFRVALGHHAGFVRLALPDPFIEECFLNAQAQGDERLSQRAWLMKRLEMFSYLRFPLWAEAGGVLLSIGDLASIEEGDLILFDQCSLSLSEGRPAGTVILRVGDGMSGGIDADISVDEKKAHCRITGIHRGE